MESLRQYVFTVICAALICGILSSIVSKSFAGKAIKLICGLYLSICVIQPALQIDLKAFSELSSSYVHDGKEAAAEGETMAKNLLKDIIKTETEAYILDKAEELAEDITVEVTVDQTCFPVSARLSGDVSSEGQSVLETYLETELGITKENQIWTGRN